MIDTPHTSGSLRNRLTAILIGGAAVLAILLYLVVRNYAAQIAQQGQDNILNASVTSILDAAVIRDGQLEIDFPYSSFSMLNTGSDDRVFYAIYQGDTILSGYADLPRVQGADTVQIDGTDVRIATASRVLIGANARTKISVSVAQSKDALSLTLNRISKQVAGFGAGFFALATLLAFRAT
jgi:two-component system sensor histidine kinase TctE